MADLQRIDAQPVALSVPTPENPGPGIIAGEMRTEAASINSIVNQGLQVMDDISRQNGQKDAAQLVDDIGNGKVKAPSSFEPAGLQTRSYAQSFKSSAEALYFSGQSDAFTNFANEQRAKYPTNPGAVEKALDDKRTEMLSVMGKDYQPYMDLRLKAISAQHVSSVLNAQTADNQQAAKVNGMRSLSSWSSQLATSAQWQGGLDSKSVDATAKLYDEQLQKEVIPQLRNAGLSDGQIAIQVQNAKDQALAAKVTRDYTDAGLVKIDVDTGLKVVDHAAVAAALEDINHKFAGDPRQAELQQAARAGISQASGIADQRIAANNDEQRIAGLKPVVEAQQAVELRKQGFWPGDAPDRLAAQERVDHDRAVAKAMFNPEYNASTKMSVVAGLTSVYGHEQATNQQYFQSQLLQIGSVATDKSATQESRDSAVQQVRAITENPTLMNAMMPALQAHAYGILNRAAEQKVGGEFAVKRHDMEVGSFSPEQSAKIEHDAIASGVAGDSGMVSLQGMHDLRVHNDAVYKQRMDIALNSQAGLETAQQGGIPTRQQQEAYALQVPIARQTLDGKVPQIMDPSTTAPGGSIDTYFAKSKVLGPEIRQQIEGMALQSGDPKVAMAMGSLFRMVASHVVDPAKDPDGKIAYAMTEEYLGKKGALFGKFVQSVGPVEAAKYWDSYVKTSESQNLGEPKVSAQDKAANPLQASLQHVLGTLNEAGIFPSLMGSNNSYEKAIREMSPTGRMSYLGGLGLESKSGSIRVAPGLMGRLSDLQVAERAKLGNSFNKMGVDADEQAWTSALVRDRANLEIVPDPNNKGDLLIQGKSTRANAADAFGMDVSAFGENGARNFYTGMTMTMLQTGAIAMPPGMHPNDIVPGTIQANRSYNALGMPIVEVRGMMEHTTANPGIAQLLWTYDAEDPKIRQVGQLIKTHAAGVSAGISDRIGNLMPNLDNLNRRPDGQMDMVGMAFADILGGTLKIGQGLLSDAMYSRAINAELYMGAPPASLIDEPATAVKQWLYETSDKAHDFGNVAKGFWNDQQKVRESEDSVKAEQRAVLVRQRQQFIMQQRHENTLEGP